MARPTDYRPEYCETVIELGKRGASIVEMATEIGVVRQTLHNWADQHPDFLDAFTRAKEHAQVWWERAGRDGMTADKFNSAVWAKMMGARFTDYQDRNKHEISGPDGGPIPVQTIVNIQPVRARDS